MSILFLNGVPALMVEKEKFIAVGDLHIGMEDKFSDSGIAFPNAAKSMGAELRRLIEENGAIGLVLLGDVKHRLANLTRDDMNSFREFFRMLDGVDVRVAKGNHDAYLSDLLKGMNFEAEVGREILLSEVALMHGNAMPSQEAVMKKYIVCGHGHMAAQVNGIDRKAWLVADAGSGLKEHYKEYNPGIKLVAAPAFNRLIIGSRIGYETGEHLPLLNSGLFDFRSAKAYDLYGNALGQ